MKRKAIVTLTGIAMSLVLAATGCAGTTGAASTSGGAASVASETDTKVAQGDAADEKAPAPGAAGAQAGGAPTDGTAGKPQQGMPEGSAPGASGEKPSGNRSKGGKSEEETATLKTVEPSAYAGQTVYGKVTSISDSQVTVTLGTYNKQPSVTQTSADDTETAALTSAVATVADNSTDTAAGNTDTAAGSADTASRKKKSSFTSSGEQMTITIPESLADVEIKEKYVLSITLDDQGNVTAIQVESKGRSKSKGTGNSGTAPSSENGQGTQNGQGIQDNPTVNTEDTTNL